MNDYFDQFELAMGAALERGANLPWYTRLQRIRQGRALVVLVAALVVATPAVGAVSNWFGLGSPDQIHKSPAAIGQGALLPGTSRLLSLRIADPQGGPVWALSQIRTTRGDTCLQTGRLERGRLGSLGIDGASDNDHLFHPFPTDYVGDVCGSNDALGDGFVNVISTAEVANAVPQVSPSLATCQPKLMWPQIKGIHWPSLAKIPRPNGPACQAGSARIIASGLLGPDAKAITYEAPDGKLQTERTSGRDGAYLLVFTLNQHTCTLYSNGGPCGESSSESAASPATIGPVKAILYSDGHVCTVKAKSPCRPVGFVASDNKPVTAAQVATPITVHVYRANRWCQLKRPGNDPFAWMPCNNAVPAGYRRIDLGGVGRAFDPGVLLHISFRAPVAITSSSSWYQVIIGSTGSADAADVRRGAIVRDQEFVSDAQTTPGVHRGVIDYMYYEGPTNAFALGESKSTSVMVGRFTFRVT